MRLIVARCEVTYTGRLSAYLPESTRLLMLKEDGSILVLYTDGLVENRGQDIDDGLRRLRGVFEPAAVGRPLADLARATLDGAYADHDRDDITAATVAFALERTAGAVDGPR